MNKSHASPSAAPPLLVAAFLIFYAIFLMMMLNHAYDCTDSKPIEGKVSSCWGARRSLIKMHRLILTGSQTPNEAGSLGAPPHILQDEKIHYLGGAARRRWGVGVRGFSG